MSLPAAVYGSMALTASQPSSAKAIAGEASLQKADRELRKLIAKATGSPEYWSFAAARNDYSHCYFRYPAMMVAEMQRHLISIVLQLQPNVRTLGGHATQRNAVYSTFHTIRDPKTQTVLWAFTRVIPGANRQSAGRRNFDQTVALIVDDLRNPLTAATITKR